MKCNNVESVIQEMARNQMVDAAIAEKALAHIGNCTECEARLDEQHSISNGLRALAGSYKDVEAPARVEAALLESFRRFTQPVENIPDKSTGSFEKSFHTYIIKYAAAAAILLILGIAVWQLERVFSKENKEQAVNPQPVEQPEQQQQERKEVPQEPQKKRASGIAKIQPTLRNKPQRAGIVSTVSRNRDSIAESFTGKSEIATEFIPLAAFENISEMDRGRLLRVQVPRSTLLSFGLPVNGARSNEPVMADVLIGDDGLARAIRFVR